MSETIFDVLERHPELISRLPNPYWELELDNVDRGLDDNQWDLELKTTAGIKLQWRRYDLSLTEVDAALTEIEQIIDRGDAPAREKRRRERELFG
jgi:hypothetical protein